jgi:hypothetical protein
VASKERSSGMRGRLEQSGFDCEIVEYAPTTDVRTVTFRSVRR